MVEAAIVVKVLELAIHALGRGRAKASYAVVVFINKLDAAGLALLHGLLHHRADARIT